MTTTVTCCPECGSSDVSPRVDNINQPAPEHDWRCEDWLADGGPSA